MKSTENMELNKKIQLKLIGYQSDDKYDVILDQNNDGITNLKYLYLIFIRKGLNINDIKKLRFISSGQNLKNLDENILSSNTFTKIFIFINDFKIKKNLIEKIFTNISIDSIIPPPSYQATTKIENLPLEDDTEEIYEPTTDEIKNINSKIIENFKDKDFIKLLQICVTKPELLKMASGYLESGDVIEDIENLADYNTENFEYVKECEFIMNFLLNMENTMCDFSEDYVKKVLIHFKGHLNLSLRFIISEHCLKQ